MDAQQFIDFFKIIPDDEWCVGYFVHPQNEKQHCALGHCGEKLCQETTMAFDLIRLFNYQANGKSVRNVNDGTFGCEGLGKTPKERILKVLEQIKNTNT